MDFDLESFMQQNQPIDLSKAKEHGSKFLKIFDEIKFSYTRRKVLPEDIFEM